MTLTIFFLILLSIIAQFIFLFYIDSSQNSVEFRLNKCAKFKSYLTNSAAASFVARNVRKLLDYANHQGPNKRAQ